VTISLHSDSENELTYQKETSGFKNSKVIPQSSNRQIDVTINLLEKKLFENLTIPSEVTSVQIDLSKQAIHTNIVYDFPQEIYSHFYNLSYKYLHTQPHPKIKIKYIGGTKLKIVHYGYSAKEDPETHIKTLSLDSALHTTLRTYLSTVQQKHNYDQLFDTLVSYNISTSTELRRNRIITKTDYPLPNITVEF
jgi:hypothetical protein